MQLGRIFIAAILLAASILACANPFSGGMPSQPQNVETIVAATFAALTESALEPGATPPPSTDGLLPFSMYFLNNDSAGLTQVYRLEKDGVTVKQITFEPARRGER